MAFYAVVGRLFLSHESQPANQSIREARQTGSWRTCRKSGALDLRGTCSLGCPVISVSGLTADVESDVSQGYVGTVVFRLTRPASETIVSWPLPRPLFEAMWRCLGCGGGLCAVIWVILLGWLDSVRGIRLASDRRSFTWQIEGIRLLDVTYHTRTVYSAGRRTGGREVRGSRRCPGVQKGSRPRSWWRTLRHGCSKRIGVVARSIYVVTSVLRPPIVETDLFQPHCCCPVCRWSASGQRVWCSIAVTGSVSGDSLLVVSRLYEAMFGLSIHVHPCPACPVCLAEQQKELVLFAFNFTAVHWTTESLIGNAVVAAVVRK